MTSVPGPLAVVFDLGNVVNRWQPAKALAAEYGSQEAAQAQMDACGFLEWNAQQDRGRSLADGLAAAPDERCRQLFRAYFDNIALAHDELIETTARTIRALDAEGVSLFAITNAPREAAATMRAQHDVIGLFRDVVVSAAEGVMKPDARIFAILCERNGLEPGRCIFIDDSARNVDGARAFGMKAIHFTPELDLMAALQDQGVAA